MRMALGANRASVVRPGAARHASFRMLLGLIVGMPLAIGAGRPDIRATLLRVQLGSTRVNRSHRHAGDLHIFRSRHCGLARRFHLSDRRVEGGLRRRH